MSYTSIKILPSTLRRLKKIKMGKLITYDQLIRELLSCNYFTKTI